MPIERVQELRVYEAGFEAAMTVFEWSKRWPSEEKYALTDQVRRSSRSVCTNLAEAWAKRRYPSHFVSKLTDAHAEAEETLVWLAFAARCGYHLGDGAEATESAYRRIIGGLVRMISNPDY
jgi:four helix bundle protein